MADTHVYSLGTSEAELARLDARAALIATPTVLFLDRAGIGPGMRVLDLTGLGHEAFHLRKLVGATSEVVGSIRPPRRSPSPSSTPGPRAP